MKRKTEIPVVPVEAVVPVDAVVPVVPAKLINHMEIPVVAVVAVVPVEAVVAKQSQKQKQNQWKL